jgi:hypothetical protein
VRPDLLGQRNVLWDNEINRAGLGRRSSQLSNVGKSWRSRKLVGSCLVSLFQVIQAFIADTLKRVEKVKSLLHSLAPWHRHYQ